jgi:predicted DNA-binding transcriptional regulator AlpA
MLFCIVIKKHDAMNIEILQQNPELAKDITLQVKGSDLLSFANELARQTAKQTEARIQAQNKPDQLLTRSEVSEKLTVTLPTLWRWEKTGVLIPIRIGSKVRYRLSDVEKAIR